jgi:hypothetical protein
MSSSSQQHPASAPIEVFGADVVDLALYRQKFRNRLPDSLDRVEGPTEGLVQLPPYEVRSEVTSGDGLGTSPRRTGLCHLPEITSAAA